MRPVRRDALLGGLLVPMLFTGYLLVLSQHRHGVRGLFDYWRLSAFPVAWYLVPLASLGALLGVARHERLYRSAALAAVSLVAVPLAWFDPASGNLFQMNAPTSVLAVVAALVAATEYAARNRNVARRWVTRDALTTGLGAGVVHAVAAVAVRSGVFGFSPWVGDLFGIGLLAWSIVGTVLVGAAPAVLYVRLRLVTPALVVAGLFAAAFIDTWQYVQAVEASGAAMSATASTFTLYVVGWFVPLAAALLVGAGEYVVRRELGVAPPPSDSAS